MSVRLSTLVLVLFTVYLVGCHLRLSIYTGDGSILVPTYLVLLSSGALMAMFSRSLLNSIGATLIVFAAFVLTQPSISLAPKSISLGPLFSGLQLFASVVSALSLICALSHVDRNRIRRYLIAIWLLFVMLAIVESTGMKPAFDLVRESLYSSGGRFIYAEELRDVDIYGRVRPTVFASEPSFLADTLSGLILMVFFLGRRTGQFAQWLRFGGMFVISYMVSPSFKMAFFFLAAIVWMLWPKNERQFVALMCGLIFFGSLLSVFYARIFEFLFAFAGGHLASGSFFGRIVVGPIVGWDALTTFPIYGYGVGNDEGILPVMSQAWQNSGAYQLFPWYYGRRVTDLMTNGFWWQWIFFGLGGGLVLTALVVRLLGGIGVEKPLRAVVCTWIVWYSGFAFVDPSSWYMVVIFSVGAIVRLRRPRLFKMPAGREYTDGVGPVSGTG